MLTAASVLFLAVGGLFYWAARKRLLRNSEGRRSLELSACVLVSLLAVGGFGFANIGMNASWTGHATISGRGWLVDALLFSGALLAAHVALRLLRTPADQLVLPIAGLLSLLGLLNVYVWETRDANAYVSTSALPALRGYQASVARDQSLRPQRRAELLRTLGTVPNELSFERKPGRSATVLDSNWVAAYNGAVRRYEAVRTAGGGHAAVTVREVRLDRLLHKQLLAVGLGVLLVPLVLLIGSRAPPGLTSTRIVHLPVVAVLGLMGLAMVTSAKSSLPPLLRLGGYTVTVFELIKVGLVVLLAQVLGRGSPARATKPTLVAIGLTIAVMLWRDPGAGLTLLAVAAFLSTLTLGRLRHTIVVAAGVAAVVAAPAAIRVVGGQLPNTVHVRLQMWTDPRGSYEGAAVENEVARALDRVVGYRLQTADGRRRRTLAGASSTLTAGLLARDADHIEQELRWRLAALEDGGGSATPLVPDGDSVEVLDLLEAEELWSALGGFRASGLTKDGKARLRSRVDEAIRELRAGAHRIEASILAGRPARSVTAPDDFQLQRGLYALDKGGVLGVGLGRGRPEAVPRLTEDLALASIGESLGLAGVLLVALFVLLVTVRGIELGRRQSRPFLGLLAVGLSALLGLQAVISLGGLTGIVPFTGLTFPFVSRSGTGVVSGYLLVALLMAISAHSPQSSAPRRRIERRSSLFLQSSGFPLAFAFVLGSVGLLQLTGRMLSAEPVLAGLPGRGAAFLHAGDQWEAPGYRRVPGSILDRDGSVLARTASFGGDRLFPDARTATSLAHTLLQLDLSFHDKLLGDQPASRLIGPRLVTTIDSGVQRAVDAAFDEGSGEAGLQDTRALRGAIAVVDVRDGGIVALLSRPRFALDELSDPVAWAQAEARERRSGSAYRFLDRAVHGLYPPGSIFKTVTAAGILERGFHTLHSRDFDYNRGPLGRRPPDGIDQLGAWHELKLPDGPPISDGNHPQLDDWLFELEDAYIWSCNVAFAQMGLELGPADLVNFAHRFGFERPLRVPGLGTSTSALDGDRAKPIDGRYLARSASNLARTAFGQGRARVTPLQMALVPAAIANGGTIMQPHVVAGWQGSDGRWLERYRPQVFADTRLSHRTIADLRRMMWASVSKGWARTARVNPNNRRPGVAGKTGSAEWSEELDASHAWFIGFFPVEAPRLALAVVVERGGAGPTVAGRIARHVFSADAVQRYVERASPR